ncbi:hypothetical protein [Streptomyces sp. NRRL F-2664]|uniref:hypothetical protein n=1 Tax=Streptomyces sp. NRRL F-2664 TaxID=1463842 RepID=UPI00099670D6|nr:hypothetical protein [Streptomyces sp. NRRL F-2664]
MHSTLTEHARCLYGDEYRPTPECGREHREHYFVEEALAGCPSAYSGEPAVAVVLGLARYVFSELVEAIFGFLKDFHVRVLQLDADGEPNRGLTAGAMQDQLSLPGTPGKSPI